MEDKRNDQASEPRRGDLPGRPDRLVKTITAEKIVLASSSPRRAEILRMVGWPFDTSPVEIDESLHAGEDATTYVQRLAQAKAEAAAFRSPGFPIVGADTVVVIDREILGKPRDDEDARRMLRLLSDRWHQVLTGVAILNGARFETKVAHETTEVKFARMSEQEISWYVATGEPMDKAGAYAIQGLGARFVEGIKGDYFNIVGLPVRLVYRLVREIKI